MSFGVRARGGAAQSATLGAQMRPVAVMLVAQLALGCASVKSVVSVTGAPGAPTNRPLPVYYALAPEFPTQEIGVIESVGRGVATHVEDLLRDAEARARRLGADALIVRQVQTIARNVPRTEFRPCGRVGMFRMSNTFTCPVIVNALEVDMRLVAAAVRRWQSSEIAPPWAAAAPSAATPWGAPPPRSNAR